MRVLVTGGAGFIGSHVVDALINKGHEVLVIDDLSHGREENINKSAVFERFSINERDRLRNAFEGFGPKAVIHNAARIDVQKSIIDPYGDAETNIMGTVAILEESTRSGVASFVYPSSVGIYGDPKSLPVKESHESVPKSFYALSKRVAEDYLLLFGKLHKVKTIILRYSNIYGPRQTSTGEGGVFAVFTQKMLQGETPTIFGDGSKTRDYVNVEDVVRINLMALEADISGVFNVGSGNPVKDIDVYKMLAREIGFKTNPIFADVREGEIIHMLTDSSSAKKTLGWYAKKPISEGAAEVVDYYRNAGH